MRLSVIIIGDEILIGQVTDTNSGAIARALNPKGWEVVRVLTVSDDHSSISNAISTSMADSDLIITTGGLGPTKDDITKVVLTQIFGGELRQDPEVLENVRTIFYKRGLKLNPLTEAQAMVPTSCRVIQNRFGTAPIMWFEREGKVLVSMPGVPFETEGMLPEVIAQIKQHFNPDEQLLHASMIVGGITESDLATKLSDYEASLPEGLHLAYLPANGYIRLRLDGRGEGCKYFEQELDHLYTALGDLLIHKGDATPAQIVLKALGEKGLSLATAESCTGGNIAHRITAIPGSSEVFLGSVVSYANSIKMGLLGVGQAELEAHGAVSREVVEQMALGICQATGANCGIATSGIAGPGGGSDQKPVGTVWMAWCVNGKVSSKVVRCPGNRTRVIDRATDLALLGILKLI